MLATGHSVKSPFSSTAEPSVTMPPLHSRFWREIQRCSPVMSIEDHSMPFSKSQSTAQISGLSFLHPRQCWKSPGDSFNIQYLKVSFFFDVMRSRNAQNILFHPYFLKIYFAMYLFRNKINIWNHCSIWLVFAVRDEVSISSSRGESAAAVISHYRASLYLITKNSIALLNKIILIPHPPPKTWSVVSMPLDIIALDGLHVILVSSRICFQFSCFRLYFHYESLVTQCWQAFVRMPSPPLFICKCSNQNDLFML